MTTKAKLVSTIAAFCLVLALLIVGVLAVPSATINMGGQISFEATDVNATVAINVEGTAENDTSDDKTFTFNAEEGQATEDWTGKNWVFDETRTIKVTITVTNLDSVRSLNVTFTPPTTASNLKVVASSSDSKTVSDMKTLTPTTGNEMTYTVTFTPENENLAVNAASWTAKLVLANVEG